MVDSRAKFLTRVLNKKTKNLPFRLFRVQVCPLEEFKLTFR